jgi:arabinofuranosyltransferase
LTTGGDTVELAPHEDRPAEPAAAPARRVRAATVIGIAVLLVPAAIVLWCGWQRRWTADDGFINFRVVRQIVEGHGPVFNVGDRVETATSPVWVAVLALLDLLTPFRLEWIAAVTGLAATAGALVLSVFGTRRALRGLGATGLFLPLGALVYASLPPAWDFATSGLETGISLLWLAACWWFLCGRLALRPAARAGVVWYVPIVLGLGPLVRPDFLVFSAAFVLALVVLSRSDEVVRVIALALVVPVVTELVRMAYYASLVPNTALAK